MGRQAAAGGDDGFRPGGKFPDQLLFQRAKGGFAVGRENFRDGPPCARLDDFVRVEIIEMQLFGDEPADGRLARAHETDERDVDDVAVVVHDNELTESEAAAHADNSWVELPGDGLESPMAR